MESNKNLFDYLLYTLVIINVMLLLFFGYKKLAKGEADILTNMNNPEPNTYIVRINLNGADKVDEKKLTCTIDEDNKCSVHLPFAYRNNGKVMGYSVNSHSINPDYLMDTDINITSNMELFVISFKVNNLYIEDDEVDSLANDNLSCIMYNDDEYCNIKLPSFNKVGYENKGYSTSLRSLTGFVYPSDNYKLSEDTILYPIYATSARHQAIEVEKTIVVNNSFVEIEKNCKEDVYPEYISYLNEIKEFAPYLLFGNKISLIGDSTFNEIWGSMYVGMNYGPRKLRAIDIRCSDLVYNDYYATMVHELSHSWDYYYSTKYDVNITSQNDIINLFNKYSKMSDRPFRAYSYSNIYEFFADAVKYYYFKYLKPTPEFSNLAFPSDIKKVLEKYICIANNDYNESKCGI